MTSLPSRAEARVLCANDIFFDLLDRRPAVAGQLAEEMAALAGRYLEQHPPRVQRAQTNPMIAPVPSGKEE